MKKAILAAAVAMAATGVQADDWMHRGDGFSLFGDVEINLDVKKPKQERGAGVDTDSSSVTTADDSRILAGVQWRTSQENGNFVTAVGETLLKATGDVEMDDAFFAMGNKDNWFFQVGRFEAWDLFPLGKDVAFSYANGSDEVTDAFDTSKLYVYRGAEARGRAGSNAGQARVQAQMNGFTGEVSTTFGKTKFKNDDFTSPADDDNSFMIRPVINYTTDDGFLSASFGGEWEARQASYGKSIDTANGKNLYASDRYGLAATTTMQFGPLAWHISAAYQDVDEFRKSYSIGSNVEFMEQWGAGFVYAQNDLRLQKDNADYAKPKGYIIYGAYTMPVLGFDNAEVTFGLSYADTKNANGIKDNRDKDTMFRTRFNYYF